MSAFPATVLTVKQLRGLLFLLPVQNIPVNSIGTTVSELRALLAQVEDQDTPVVEAIPDLALVGEVA